MKCLLVLLALELVSSDKLDRTYLPPPGAKYSGGTLDDLHPPLEYPKTTYPGIVQNRLDNIPRKITGIPQEINNGIPTGSFDYSSSISPNNFKTTSSNPAKFKNTVPKPNPGLNFDTNFPSRFPSASYLPSKPMAGPQFYTMPQTPFYATTRPEYNFEASQLNTELNGNFPRYYFVPVAQNTALVQYPNQNNNDFYPGGLVNVVPQSGTSSIIAQNYQPNAFGFYGGNPMIMTSLNQMPLLNDNNGMLKSKFGDNGVIMPVQTTVGPFQTPSTSAASYNKESTNPFTSTTESGLQNTFQLPTATIRSSPKNQRNGIRSRPRYRRPERPQAESDRNAVIVNYDNNISPDGYSYSYDTSNGIHAEETATANNGVRAKGSYSYTGDDGKVYTVTYTADENGFRPQGDHIPTAPPIPEAIQKIIEKAAKDEATGIIDDGSYDESKYGHLNYEGNINRYLPKKKNGEKPLKLNGFRRRPINKQLNDSNNKNKVPTGIGNQSNSNVQNNKEYNKIVALPIYEATNGDNVNENTLIYTGTRTGLQKNGQTKEKQNLQSRILIANQESPDTDNFYLDNTNNSSKKTSETVTKKPFELEQSPGSAVTFNNSGYYYVPPQIRFNSNLENITTKDSSYPTINNVTLENKIIMRNGFDKTQSVDYKLNSTPLPVFKSTDSTTTRKPYFSGPESQEKSIDEVQSASPIESVNDKEFSTYPNDLSSSPYLPNTTPITPSVVEEIQSTVDNSQYYQPSTNPTLFDQKLPSTFENRVNLPSSKPGITVTQDFTTTIRPETLKNGVLEVKQNVKIYGLGKPETGGYPGNNPKSNVEYNNDVFYPTTTQNGATNFFGTSSTFYPGPVQDTRIAQEIPNQDIFEGNKYLTAGLPEANNGVVIPENNLNGLNSIEPQGYPSQVPSIPFRPDLYGNSASIPIGPDATTPIIVNSNERPQSPGIVIGEDFSGPQQAQKFDPVNGYYYK